MLTIPRTTRRLRRITTLWSLTSDHLLPVALYIAITMLMTWPLLAHFGAALPGDGRDAWQNYWDFWWLRQALATRQSPFWTPLLYAPYGAPLYLHTLNLFNGLVTLPVQIGFGLTAAYNSVVFLSFALSAYFSYLLVSYTSGSRIAGFFGGIIYAFGSYHLAHLLGHTNLLASEWLPAYILCLLMACDAQGKRRRLLVLAGVASLILLMFCDWQYILLAGLFTAVWAPWAARDRRSVTPLIVAGAIGIGWAVLAAPLLYPLIRFLRDTAATRPPVLGPERFSADLLSLIVPSPLQSWWGPAAEQIGGHAVAPVVERAVFLGFVPLILALCGIWLQRRSTAVWALGALLFALLALGPRLQVNGAVTSIPLPYRLLEQIPGLNIARVPARFALLTTLCLAVLAGLGLVGLAQWRPARSRPRLLAVAAPLLTLLLLAEHFPAPYPLTPVNEPAFYRQLAASDEPGAVLELPFSMTRSTSLFGQTIHGRPIVGGYLSRPLAYRLLDLPPFHDAPGDDFFAPAPSDAGNWVLQLAGVRWIVVLLDVPRLNRAEIDAFLSRYAEPTVLYQDDRMAVYRPRPPDRPGFFLQATGDWHLPELLPDQRRMRWNPGSGSLIAWSLAEAPQAGTLRFEAWSFHVPRRLAILLDGQQLAEWLVADPTVYSLPVVLEPGEHQIEFRSLDPPERPARTLGGDDTRLIAIGVAGIEIVPPTSAR